MSLMRTRASSYQPNNWQFIVKLQINSKLNEIISNLDYFWIIELKPKMTQTLMLLIALLLHTKCTLAQPADLSGMGPPNDVQVGAVYSFPSEAGRTPQPNDLLFAFINYTYTQKSGTVVSFAEEKAKFGEGNDNPVNGTLVHVTNIENLSDHTACSHNIRGTLGEALPKRDWIALIQRGDCKFDEKVGNVYRHGAIGAIIYDSRDTASLDKMKIDDKSRKCHDSNLFAFKTCKTWRQGCRFECVPAKNIVMSGKCIDGLNLALVFGHLPKQLATEARAMQYICLTRNDLNVNWLNRYSYG